MKFIFTEVYAQGETEQVSDFSKCDFNHNHGEENNLNRQEVNNACKRKAWNNLSERPSKIVSAEVSPRDGENELTTGYNAFVRRNLYNARLSVYPILPKSTREVQEALASVVVKTNRDEELLLDNGAEMKQSSVTCN
jgi:hypothetical protein